MQPALVPEAPVDKYSQTRAPEHEVRFAWEPLVPPPTNDACFAKDLSQS